VSAEKKIFSAAHCEFMIEVERKEILPEAPLFDV
jgi:hypothetical protein